MRRNFVAHNAPSRGAVLSEMLRSYSPVCAYLFSDMGRDLVKGNFIFTSGGVVQKEQSGYAHVTDNANDATTLLSSDDSISTTEVTILLHYQKRDATLRASNVVGVRSTTTSTRCGMHAPYSDGSTYWDFGGASEASTRCRANGLAFGNDVWAFSSGPRGMQIWQNGFLRASNVFSPTRTTGSVAWGVGMHGTVTQLSDFANLYSIILLNKQMPELELRWITQRARFYERAFEIPRRRSFAVVSAAPSGFSPWWASSARARTIGAGVH